MDGADFCSLPEGCISHILSLTSPRDVCKSSLVSSIFRSAADSDAVWERFLPSDHPNIISRSVSPLAFSSKKELYFRLCDPILVDGGKKSFALEKSSGRKCYMLGARELAIVWGDDPRYWRWISSPESRFSEVVELVSVCWLEICGKFDTCMLSPKTVYVAYLVVKFHQNAFGLATPPAELSVRVGCQVTTRSANLQPEVSRRQQRQEIIPINFRMRRQSPWHRLRSRIGGDNGGEGQSTTIGRSNDWTKIEIGEFFNSEGGDGEVEMSVMEVKGGHWKEGLIILGIELCPKLEATA